MLKSHGIDAGETIQIVAQGGTPGEDDGGIESEMLRGLSQHQAQSPLVKKLNGKPGGPPAGPAQAPFHKQRKPNKAVVVSKKKKVPKAK